MAVLEAATLNVKNIKQHVINCFLLRLPSCLPQTRTIAVLHLWTTQPLTMTCCLMKFEVACASLRVCVYLHARVHTQLWLVTCWLDTDQGYFSRLYFNIFNRYKTKYLDSYMKWSMLSGFFLPTKTANIYVNVIFNQLFHVYTCTVLSLLIIHQPSLTKNMDVKDFFHLSVITYADKRHHILLINYHLSVFSRLSLKCSLNCPLCLLLFLGVFLGFFLVWFL